MLVLSRRPVDGRSAAEPGEDTLVFRVAGVEFRVVIVGVDRNKVSVGIDAPREVVVWRGDLDNAKNNTKAEGA